ncbi:XRE family transcriptional regulator [Pseudonocardia kongjuensis]|uniref:XRE family transcriptional regulator n=1 Tax=Pseudonocardia kongjuensis TaxID=102227 RepID=UPI0031D75782
MSEAEDEADLGPVARYFRHLVKHVHPADRGPYTLEEISEGIRRQGGPSLSVPYLSQLRSGARPNPTHHVLEALAEFFNQPVSPFFNATEAQHAGEDLALMQALRDSGVKDIALRAMDLSPETRQSISRLIQDMSDLDQRAQANPRRRRKGSSSSDQGSD